MSLDGDGNSTITSMYEQRIVFGFEIGAECEYKTPAEAFVERLWLFEYDIAHAKNEEERQKILECKTNFLEVYKQELLPEERVEDVLRDALAYSKQQETVFKHEIQNYESHIEKFGRFIDVSKDREFLESVCKPSLAYLGVVSECVGDIIEKEKEFVQE